jgi:hypothetical protein
VDDVVVLAADFEMVLSMLSTAAGLLFLAKLALD